MITGSKAHKELKIILENKLLMKDIGQLSHRDQTSRLESFHKVMIQFASKALHFHYPSMEARFVKSLLQYEQSIKLHIFLQILRIFPEKNFNNKQIQR